MFKLVVLSLFAAVAAEPGLLLAAPYTSYTSVVAPATTTITKSASSVVHPSPLFYSSPFAYPHFIKKRSAQFLGYNGFYPGATIVRSYPYSLTSLGTPVVHSGLPVSTILPAAHLIKKRSAQLLVTPTTYAAAPVYTSTYATSPIITTPLIHSTPYLSSPLSYSTHFIKKRSAPLLTTYVAPSSFSHQSRIDISHDTPTLKLTSYPSSLYSYPYYY